MEYTCSMCNQTFTSDWSEEEAQAEAEKNFGDICDPETDALVCEECYNEVMKWRQS